MRSFQGTRILDPDGQGVQLPTAMQSCWCIHADSPLSPIHSSWLQSVLWISVCQRSTHLGSTAHSQMPDWKYRGGVSKISQQEVPSCFPQHWDIPCPFVQDASQDLRLVPQPLSHRMCLSGMTGSIRSMKPYQASMKLL